MKTIKTVCVVGGDTRQIYTARRLAEHGLAVCVWGFENFGGELPGPSVPSPREAMACDAAVLPLPCTKNGRALNAPFAREELSLRELETLVRPGAVIFPGMAPEGLVKTLSAKGAEVFDYYRDEALTVKNALLTAEGISRLNRQGWDIRYRAVGKVKDEKIRTGLERYGFVSFSPPQPHETLIHEYRQADIFAMPSHTETFGLVYAEAMSQGLPVIYTRGQGFDGQFPEGTVGYSVDSHDAEEMAETIVKVCRRYGELSKNGVEKVQRFRWDNIVQEYLEIYARIDHKGS